MANLRTSHFGLDGFSSSQADSERLRPMALQVEEFGQRGIRCMAVARTDADSQWHMLGLLTFLDPPRPDTKATLETALHYGVQTRMVS